MAKKKGLGKGLDALLGDAFSAASKKRQINQADARSFAPAQMRSKSVNGGLSADLSKLGKADAELSKPAPVMPTEQAKPANISTLDQGAAKSNSESQVNLDTGMVEHAINPSDDNHNQNQPNLKSDILLEIPVELCQRGKYQPRRDIDPVSLEELAASIASQGVMQPIIIRSIEADSGQAYEIIAGERRWRAAQLAGLTTVPAVIKQVPDEAAMAMALVENLQREDLNPMEEAYALARLNKEFELTHQQVADIVGKSRAAVSNSLRLMNLHKDVKLLLENGDLEMGHARALLGLETGNQLAAAKDIVNRSLNVRQTEALVKNLQAPKSKKSNASNAIEDPNISRLQNDLSEKLGVPVAFSHHPSGGGKLTLKYNSLDELDGILEHIK